MRDVESRGLADEVVKQRGLADPGLAAQDEYGAVAVVHVIQQPVQHRKLAPPTDQGRWDTTVGHHVSFPSAPFCTHGVLITHHRPSLATIVDRR